MNNTANSKRCSFRAPMSQEEFEAKKAEYIAIQKHNLEMIAITAEFLNDFLTIEPNSRGKYKVSMPDVLNNLEEKGFDKKETKAISQFNYLMLDLANAYANKYISNDRVNIRVVYIEERLKTSFKKELHDFIVQEIINKYNVLFYWHESATGENYEPIENGKDNVSEVPNISSTDEVAE